MAPLASPASRYRTTIVEDEDGLLRLLPEWWALWSRTARATPFSSPAWLLPWWDAFHPGELFTAAVRRDGLLVGLAPFYIEAGAADAGDLFETLAALHTRRWEASGEPGVLSDPAVLAFHRAAVPRLQASNLLRLSALAVDDAVVSAYYGFAHRGRGYGYLNGFDPSSGFDSPGTALLGHAIRHAVAEGCSSFNFLRGREDYKYAWGATDRWNVARTVRSAPASEHPGGGSLRTGPDPVRPGALRR